MIPILAFDIETIPDTQGIAKLYGLDPKLSPAEIAAFAFARRREVTGSDFLPLHQHRVSAIACALRERDSFRVWALGSAQDSEQALVQRFFDGIEKYTPQIVSWNGGGFDLPVLHYRAMVNGVRAPRYWELGEDDREFKWNNYISRYHTRHIDLMDLIALYQGRAVAPLDEIAKLCGFPGKLGMGGAQVWPAFQRGEIQTIRNYCETDAANTYLMFLRFQLMRGVLGEQQYAAEIDVVKSVLGNSKERHWQEFMAAWGEPDK
jgi:predicted PolB exonuclease-like 3'-5' exonuclease